MQRGPELNALPKLLNTPLSPSNNNERMNFDRLIFSYETYIFIIDDSDEWIYIFENRFCSITNQGLVDNLFIYVMYVRELFPWVQKHRPPLWHLSVGWWTKIWINGNLFSTGKLSIYNLVSEILHKFFLVLSVISNWRPIVKSFVSRDSRRSSRSLCLASVTLPRAVGFCQGCRNRGEIFSQ